MGGKESTWEQGRQQAGGERVERIEERDREEMGER